MSMFFCKRQPECTGKRTLATLKEGEKAVVRCLHCAEGCHMSKLAAMGLTPGTEVEMLSNSGGSLLILVRSGRLCLCRNMAQAIVVE